MKHITILKSIVLSLAFAFCLTTVSAQNSNTKSKKKTTEQRIQEAKSLDASEKEPGFKYIYSIANVVDDGGRFIFEFQESKNHMNEERLREMKETVKRSSDRKSPATETDLINSLAEQGFELISIIPFPGKEGKIMKYYFRTKVKY